MSDLVAARIRTIVPAAWGALLTWLATRLGVVVDEDSARGAVTAMVTILTGIVYFVASALERRYPAWGWLLGYAARPTYPDVPTTGREV